MPFTRLVALVSLIVAIAVVGSSVHFVWPHSAQAGGTLLIVDTTADTISSVDGLCSLREAITAANSNANVTNCGAGSGFDGIEFALGPGTPTINIGATPLPSITDPVDINGGPNRVEIRGPGGPLLSSAHGLTVAVGGSSSFIRNLVINNHADDGIRIDGNSVTLRGNYIGTDVTGTIAVPNQGFGVQVLGEDVVVGGATTGGPCSEDCNVISGNLKSNVLLDVGSQGAVVKGNFIGTNGNGLAAIVPNETQGVVNKGNNNRIGGSGGTTPAGACTGDCNLISGNNINGGIVIEALSSGGVIEGNFIGTDVTGTLAISNGLSEGFSLGILAYTGVQIGGAKPESRNVVSGNRGTNIQIRGLGSVVRGNYIGTNSAGTAPVPMSGPGIYLTEADGAVIGGTADGAENLISGASNNGNWGIAIAKSVNTQVTGNLIGTAADGVTPLPNTSDGIIIFDGSTNAIIGGLPENSANTIAHNGGAGVRIGFVGGPAIKNTISANTIHSNAGLGIDLDGDGVTANDDEDPDTGENALQNFPTVELLIPVSTTLPAGPLQGTPVLVHLNSTPNNPFSIEFFSSPECDPSGYGEGQSFVFSLPVMTDAEGNFSSTLGIEDVPPGHFVTTTATNTGIGDTSEFSACFEIPGEATPTPTPSPTPTPIGQTPTPTPTPTPAGQTPTPPATPSPTGTPGAFIQGDNDCDGDSDAVDALVSLQSSAGFPYNQQPNCLLIGAAVPASADLPVFGDIDCDGDVDAVDALQILRNVAGLSVNQAPGCPAIGQAL